MPRVLVVGDVINDILAVVRGPLRHGQDNTATIRTRAGGSAANQAAWLASLGVDVAFAGRAGAADAAFHRQELARFGVEPHLAADESAPTGSIVVLTGPDGERTMITSRGANLNLCQADVPAALLDGADLLHLTGYTLFEPGTRAVARGLIAEAGRRGIPFTVDPGSAAFLGALGPGEFLGWTSTAAVCFPNHDEAVVLAGQQSEPARPQPARHGQPAPASQTRRWQTRHALPRSWHGTTAWSHSSWARTARWSPPPERPSRSRSRPSRRSSATPRERATPSARASSPPGSRARA